MTREGSGPPPGRRQAGAPLLGALKWSAGAALGAALAATLFVALFGWNWLRGPLERAVLERTGRALVIHGTLHVAPGWPAPRVRADAVTFANPSWAKQAQMIAADAVAFTIDLRQLLLSRHVVFPEVRLVRAAVFLERDRDGRRNWLLDRAQRDEAAHVRIGRLTLDHAALGYDDPETTTSLRSELASSDTLPDGSPGAGLVFHVHGRFKGLPFEARGSGGPVLALRDQSTPYPLSVEARIGGTRVRASGTITSLTRVSAVDVRLALRGASLEQLYPLLGIAFPATHAYATEGRLRHRGSVWRYEKFSGRIGSSDLAGTFEVMRGGKRPQVTANLVSGSLDVADLGPLIGARHRPRPASAAPGPGPSPRARPRVLPDLPFNADRWTSVDADVTLRARTLRAAADLPLEDLATHLRLRDGVLDLDPLRFGVAGGHLDAMVSLDGRSPPIRAHARIKARNLSLTELLPATGAGGAGFGRVNGEIDLAGRGNSVGDMLATSGGRVRLAAGGGAISRLAMERVSLHLWEMLALKITGDERIRLHCAVADAAVRDGIVHPRALVFDTDVTTVVGSGSVDLRRETLDLTLDPHTKHLSPVALHSPIHVRGPFAHPDVGPDKGPIAARTLGAIGLAAINPLLALAPLIDAGATGERPCGA